MLWLILCLLSGPLETRGSISRGLILKIKLSVSIPRALLRRHFYSFIASPSLWRPPHMTTNQCSWSLFHCIHCLFLQCVYPLIIPCGQSFLLSFTSNPCLIFIFFLFPAVRGRHFCHSTVVVRWLWCTVMDHRHLSIFTQQQQLSNWGWNSFNCYDLNDGRHGVPLRARLRQWRSICGAPAAPSLLAGCGGWMQKYPSPFRVNGRQ